MKKNDWILIIAIALYSLLFYQQWPGINYLIFNIALITLLAVKDKAVCKQKTWLIVAAGSLLSSFCIALYGNTLSVIANIISLSVLSGLSYNAQSSVVFSLLFTVYSYCSAPVFMIMDKIEQREKQITNSESRPSQRIWLIIIPVVITLIFFFMYRSSNALFNDFSNKINIDFISWDWIAFTLGGVVLLYGFFYHRSIAAVATLEENVPAHLSPVYTTANLFGKQLTIEEELFSGKLLFTLLNLLLLMVNVLDINFLFLGGALPKGVTYSEFVHQGTGMLITSIVIAVIIILFYFRGAINFYEKNTTIKLLAYVWIAQNAFMLVSTAMRNDMYIGEYGLTYKRIGVYVYLLLTLCGLVTTAIKIFKLKTNIYLFRSNGWLFYTVLAVSCVFNWDMIITQYNIQYPKKVEKNYLLELSLTNLPQLLALQNDTSIAHKEFKLNKDQLVDEDYDRSLEYNQLTFDQQVGRRLYCFVLAYQSIDWRSWNYDLTRVHDALTEMNGYGKLTKIDLSEYGIIDLNAVSTFKNITELDVRSNHIYKMDEITRFAHLKKLDLSFNPLIKLNGIENLTKLEYLSMRDNHIRDYSPLYKLKQLKTLHVEDSISQSDLESLKINLPHTNIIKGLN